MNVLDQLDPAIRREKKIIEMFLRLGPTELDEIEQAVEAEALQRAAHKLKGTAGILGLRRLAAACAELERAARERDPATSTHLEAVAREFASTCDSLRRELSSGDPDALT